MRDRPGIRCTMICVAITLSYLILASLSCPTVNCATQESPFPESSTSLTSNKQQVGHQLLGANNDELFKLDDKLISLPSIDRLDSREELQPTGAAARQLAEDGAKEMGGEQQVHKLMSEQDLRRTFQVDNHEQVPEYEILKLTVSEDGSHMISPISDLGEITEQQQQQHNDHQQGHMNHENNEKKHVGGGGSRRNQDDVILTARWPESVDLSAEALEDKIKERGNDNQHRHRELDGGVIDDDEQHKQHDTRRRRRRRRSIENDNNQLTRSRRSARVNSGSASGSKSSSFLASATSSNSSSDITEDAKATKSHKSTRSETTIKPSDDERPPPASQQEPIISAVRSAPHQQQQHSSDDDKPIVMQLSTFGQEFRLKLRRNADFQARLKGMKMFMAESTGDGRLRYTEIRGPSQRPGQDVASSSASTTTTTTTTTTRTHHQEPHKRAAKLDTETDAETDAETETAASVEADSPQSSKTTSTTTTTTKRPISDTPTPTKSSAAADTWNIGSTYHDEDNLAALLIERDSRTGQLRVDGTIGNDFVIKPVPEATLEAIRRRGGAGVGGSSAPDKPAKLAGELERAASHLHDDDPHDDDEMFLDEDEAFEMARDLRQVAGSGPASSPWPQQQQQQVQSHHELDEPANSNQTARTLSKAASERKWRKYRKTMAQTQVPKLGAARARRHAPAASTISHHIVYRQRPSSEGSSADHQASPLAMLDSIRGAGRVQLIRSPQQQHEHLSSQFLLEPAELDTPPDWSLFGERNSSATGAAAGAAAELPNRRVKRSLNQTPTRRLHQVRRKRQAPDTVWPEVLLVVDYDSFLLHGGDSRDVKRYFVSFWNGVDLRYKLLVHPHIRISLAGMIVAKDRDATPYLERNRLRAPNADAVDAAGALTDMGKYLYREDRLPTYDLAVVITKLDMCRRRYEGGRCNRGTAGFAYVGGACVVNKRLEKVNSVAIIEDSGGFSGIIVAAHEVGHLLGCVHDGSPPPSYLGGPGAVHCPWEDGFIMSDLRHTERGFRWSQCSIEQFKHFLNGETATCLYNYPHESQMLHRLLPGTMLSLDEQCKRDRGTNACFKDARVCAQLFCFDSASGYCVSYRPAAEGSPCGEGQVCRNGKCVGEIENIIPDYTHHTQSVVASNQPALVRRAPLGPGPPSHLSTRMAYNGLSASSTSAATVPPETAGSKLASSMSPASSAAVISSRMDTFSANDGPANNAPVQYGARYLQSASPGLSTSGLMLMSSSATTPTQQARHSRTPASPKSAKPSDPYYQQQQQQQNHSVNRNQAYQQRMGLSASSLQPIQANTEPFAPITNTMRYPATNVPSSSVGSPVDPFAGHNIDININSKSSNPNSNNYNYNLLTSSTAFQPRSQPPMLQHQSTTATSTSTLKQQQIRHHQQPQRSPFYDAASAAATAGLDSMPHDVDGYSPIPSVQYHR